jgi:hypothetical protein
VWSGSCSLLLGTVESGLKAHGGKPWTGSRPHCWCFGPGKEQWSSKGWLSSGCIWRKGKQDFLVATMHTESERQEPQIITSCFVQKAEILSCHSWPQEQL